MTLTTNPLVKAGVALTITAGAAGCATSPDAPAPPAAPDPNTKLFLNQGPDVDRDPERAGVDAAAIAASYARIADGTQSPLGPGGGPYFKNDACWSLTRYANGDLKKDDAILACVSGDDRTPLTSDGAVDYRRTHQWFQMVDLLLQQTAGGLDTDGELNAFLGKVDAIVPDHSESPRHASAAHKWMAAVVRRRLQDLSVNPKAQALGQAWGYDVTNATLPAAAAAAPTSGQTLPGSRAVPPTTARVTPLAR